MGVTVMSPPTARPNTQVIWAHACFGGRICRQGNHGERGFVPAYVDTDMTRRTIANMVEKTGRTEQAALAELVARNPQKRLVKPEEVANAVAWLCLPGSDAITGQAIAVAGGESM